MPTKALFWLFIIATLFAASQSIKWSGDILRYAVPTDDTAGCLNFTPYVKGYDPTNVYPPPAVIDTLLDVIVRETNYTCIQTYGVLNRTHTFQAAKERGLKVMAVIWLNPDQQEYNDNSIRVGIEMAHQYKDTIISIACGSELRVRNPKGVATPLIQDCIRKVKAGNIPQPVTTNDYYWFWCEQSGDCNQWTEIVDMVDFIATNVFSWWDNKHAPNCVPASEAAKGHLLMYRNVVRAYPNHLVVISEFGWPGGPDGFAELNQFSNQPCTGYATEENQNRVLRETLNYMKQWKIPGVTFSAFRETWKTSAEGEVGPYWGFCNNEAPYTCKQGIYPVTTYPVPRPPRGRFGDVTPIWPNFPGDNTPAPPPPAPIILPPLPEPPAPQPTPIPTPIPTVIPQQSKTVLQPKSSLAITPRVSKKIVVPQQSEQELPVSSSVLLHAIQSFVIGVVILLTLL